MANLVGIVRSALKEARTCLMDANECSQNGTVIAMVHKIGTADFYVQLARKYINDQTCDVDDGTLEVLESSFEKIASDIQKGRDKFIEIGCRNAVHQCLHDAEACADALLVRESLSYANFALGMLKGADDLVRGVRKAEENYYETYVAVFLTSALDFAGKGNIAGMEDRLEIALTNGFLSDVSDKARNISRLGYRNALMGSVQKAKQLSLMETEDLKGAIDEMDAHIANAGRYAKKLGKNAENVLGKLRLSGYRAAFDAVVGKSENADEEKLSEYVDFAAYCLQKINAVQLSLRTRKGFFEREVLDV